MLFPTCARSGLVAAALIAAVAGSAGAADNDVRIDPGMAAAMQRDLGIGAAQLPGYFRAARETLVKEEQARRRFGGDFAGGWLERDANGAFKYVVATAANARNVQIPGAEVRQVLYSLRQLEDTMSNLNAVRARTADRRELEGVQSWYIDVRSNRVVVSALPNATAKAADLVAVSMANVDAIRFETAQGTATTAANVASGTPYNSGGRSCTVGFPVTKGVIKGFATAGHCGPVGTAVSLGGAVVGSVQASTFPGSDQAWANVGSTDTLISMVSGRAEYGIGAAICRTSTFSGWRCGTITATNVTVNYAAGPVYGLRQASACVSQGDSGGPWIAGNQAQGVTSGGQFGPTSQSNCQLANPVSYYQRINPLLSAYGLNLLLN